jgi:hypothetical protein
MSARRIAKTSPSANRKSALSRSPRGQAMVEYSLVTHVLFIAGTFSMMPLISWLFEALSRYYESIYFVLKSAAV